MITKKIKQRRKDIDSKLLKIWQLKLYDTNYHVIAEKTELSVMTVGNAFRDKKATQDTIDRLTKYFNEMEVEA
jgi:hypothetical protein